MLEAACGKKSKAKCPGNGSRPPSPRGNLVRCEWSFQGMTSRALTIWVFMGNGLEVVGGQMIMPSFPEEELDLFGAWNSPYPAPVLFIPRHLVFEADFIE